MQTENICANIDDELLRLRLCIARLSFLRFDEKCLLESRLQSVSQLLALSLDDISLLVGRRQRTKIWNPLAIFRLSENELKLMNMYGAKVIFYDSPAYPYLLKQIYDPPYALFYRGNSTILDTPCVAIVGTRKPSMECATATKNIAKDISMAGITVVSGLALGIDAYAHTGSLLTQGQMHAGKTIAVLGSSVDTITPSSNKRLAGAILASGGCLVSEYQMGSPVQSWQFVQRNRIISALSRVTLVMEAPTGSGALYTADFAIEHNRELCFYKTQLRKNQTGNREKDVDLFGYDIKKKRCSIDYVRDGATVVESAKEVLFLINSMSFLEERVFSVKKT